MRTYHPRSSLPFYPREYFSHALILIAVIVSLLGFMIPSIISLFWLHRISLAWDGIIMLTGQILLYQFLHGDILHILLNAFFLYQIGPEVERRMSKDRFQMFFLVNTFFVAIALWFLAPNVLTIGISGFCNALLAYLWIDLHTTRHPMANQLLFWLVVNIIIGFTGNISLVGHASGAVFGLIWWYFRKR